MTSTRSPIQVRITADTRKFSEQMIRAQLANALVALWTDRRSDKHAELYAEAMAALYEWEPQEC